VEKLARRLWKVPIINLGGLKTCQQQIGEKERGNEGLRKANYS
jgi:hypothetical protein